MNWMNKCIETNEEGVVVHDPKECQTVRLTWEDVDKLLTSLPASTNIKQLTILVERLQEWVDRVHPSEDGEGPFVLLHWGPFYAAVAIDDVIIGDTEDAGPLTLEDCQRSWIDHCRQFHSFMADELSFMADELNILAVRLGKPIKVSFPNREIMATLEGFSFEDGFSISIGEHHERQN